MLTVAIIQEATKAPLSAVGTLWPLIQKELKGNLAMEIIAAATIQTESASWRWDVREYGPHGYFHRYDGRPDLGNNQVDDGYRFRGAGPLQLTGRANFQKAGKAIGVDLEHRPELACQPENAAKIFAWYFRTHGMDVWSNRWFEASGTERENALVKLRKLVNGGTNGYDRFKQTAEALTLRTSKPPKAPTLVPSKPVPADVVPGVSSVPGSKAPGGKVVPAEGKLGSGQPAV